MVETQNKMNKKKKPSPYHSLHGIDVIMEKDGGGESMIKRNPTA